MTQRSPTVKPARRDHDAQRASARATAASTAPARPRLSTRETDIIELAMLGLTNGQIAQRLDLSTYAVKFHLSSAYSKLGVANRTQAAVAYLNLRAEGRA